MYNLTTDRKDVEIETPCLWMMDRGCPTTAYNAFIIRKSGTRIKVHVPYYGASDGWEAPNDSNVLEFSWRKSKRIWSQVGDGAPRDDCALLFFNPEREEKEKRMYDSLLNWALQEDEQ